MYPGNIELLIASMPRVAGITDMCCHAWSNFNFFTNFFPSVISFNKCNLAVSVLSVLSSCCNKYPDLREKGFIWFTVSGHHISHGRGAKCWEPEATGSQFIHSGTDSKGRRQASSVRLMVSFSFSPGPADQMVLSTLGGFSYKN